LILVIGVFVRLGFWAFSDPRVEAKLIAVVAWVLAACCLGLLLESLVFHLTADERGVRLRSLKGSYEATWDDLRVHLVQTSAESGYITHQRTLRPDEALHLILITSKWKWNLNRWMHDVGPLMQYLHARELVTLNDQSTVQGSEAMALPSAGEPPSSALDQLYGAAKIFKGLVAFSVVLMITSIVGASKLDGPTPSFYLNMFIVGAGVVAVFYCVIVVARRLRSQRQSSASSGHRTYPEDVLMAGASALGGALLLAWFVPGLVGARNSDTWVDLSLVGLGFFLLWWPIREFRAYTRGNH
jgi:hypothetical protein